VKSCKFNPMSAKIFSKWTPMIVSYRQLKSLKTSQLVRLIVQMHTLVVPLYGTKIGSADRFWQLILVRLDGISRGTQFFVTGLNFSLQDSILRYRTQFFVTVLYALKWQKAVFLGAEGKAKQFKELYSDDGILYIASTVSTSLRWTLH